MTGEEGPSPTPNLFEALRAHYRKRCSGMRFREVKPGFVQNKTSRKDS